MEKIVDLLARISELYHLPQWAVNAGAISIFCILIAFPFVAYYLMLPKYHRFKELILFKVLWRWKYKKGDVVGLWCYCPKCKSLLMVDDENCRSNEALQDKVTYFICNECGGDELGRVVGGDRRYALSLVKRDIWRHIKEGSYAEASMITKEALAIYQNVEATVKNESQEGEKAHLEKTEEPIDTTQEALHVKSEETEDESEEDVKKDGI